MFSNQTHLFFAALESYRAPTKFTNEDSFFSIGSPFTIGDLTRFINDEPKFVISLCKVLVTTFVLIDGAFPLLETFVAMGDGREERFEPGVAIKDWFGIEGVVASHYYAFKMFKKKIG